MLLALDVGNRNLFEPKTRLSPAFDNGLHRLLHAFNLSSQDWLAILRKRCAELASAAADALQLQALSVRRRVGCGAVELSSRLVARQSLAPPGIDDACETQNVVLR